MIEDDKSGSQSPGKATGRDQNESPTKYSEPNPAQRLRDLLLRADLSQRAGARELGVDERTVRYWCAGQTTPPRMAFLALERLIDMRRQVTSAEYKSITFLDQKPRVTPKQTVAFLALRNGAALECEISMQALRDHFGATTPDEAVLLEAFTRGQSKIQAAARRKLLESASPAHLSSDDF